MRRPDVGTPCTSHSSQARGEVRDSTGPFKPVSKRDRAGPDKPASTKTRSTRVERHTTLTTGSENSVRGIGKRVISKNKSKSESKSKSKSWLLRTPTLLRYCTTTLLRYYDTTLLRYVYVILPNRNAQATTLALPNRTTQVKLWCLIGTSPAPTPPTRMPKQVKSYTATHSHTHSYTATRSST